jgi:predicted ATP-dependent Lon-type protease
MADVKKQIVYHGSKEIVKSPEIRTQKYNKDFYFGFYCTLYPEQAIRWATRFNGIGILNQYYYTPDENLRVKQFSEMTEEWLDFIVACRMGKAHDYDIVEGQEVRDEK